MRIRRNLCIAVASALVGVGALLWGPVFHARAAQSADELDRSMRSVAAAYALVEKNYADPVSSERAFYQGAIPGMLHTLDPHSNFVDPAEYREMQRRQRAQYFGVGMQIGMDGAKVIVDRPFVGSPAWRADLRRGDTIVGVNGKDTSGLASPEVADLLRGPRGTSVSVTVRRVGVEQPITVEVIRGEIETTLVDAFWVRPGVAFLRIDSFEAQNVAEDVEKALGQLGEQNVKGLILDLRGNPGGLVSEAVRVAGRFLREGQLVVSHHGRAESEQVFRARAVAAAQSYPMVVLVDSRSASAAEIVSGALQDHDRAWTLGETTFGKGLVQAQFPLSEGAALLLTIAHYYTPSGRLIQRDYSHQSFFDYYYAKHGDTNNAQDLKSTDSGRKVYGGGGITPDEKYPSPVYNLFQRRLSPYSYVFFRFGNAYFNGAKPALVQDWQPDQATLERFREFLRTQKVSFTDAEFDANREWVREQIRWEFYFRAFDKPAADRARWLDDPEIKQALESLGRAQALLDQLHRILALRTAKG